MDEIRLAENLAIDFKPDKANLMIQNCLIYPKRMDRYDLGNDTVCHVGGILLGAISYFKNSTPSSPEVVLKPSEFRRISLAIN